MTEVTIHRLGQKGDGIAEGPVFAPLTLPGEVISGDLQGDTLVNARIVLPSADRVSPPCRHFKSCGGCQLQHASDRFVKDWKADTVRRALAAHGLETEFRPMHVSPAFSRRRATFAARRTKKGALVGFFARASDVIVETPDCTLLHPDLIAARPIIETIAEVGSSRKGTLSVMVTRSAIAGLDVAVTGGKPLDGPLRVTLAALAATHDLARLSWEDETVVTRRAPVQVFGRVEVVPPPAAFLQATEEAEKALVADVIETMGAGAKIVDLFAGCGTFTLPLAAQGTVHAVEGSRAMTEALDQGWRKATGLRGVSIEVRDLFCRPLEPDELGRFDAAVIDPPRAGAEAQIRALGGSSISLVSYVSCNPASFARDARLLVDSGFHLRHLRLVDQFRWSTHVEIVAEFTR